MSTITIKDPDLRINLKIKPKRTYVLFKLDDGMKIPVSPRFEGIESSIHLPAPSRKVRYEIQKVSCIPGSHQLTDGPSMVRCPNCGGTGDKVRARSSHHSIGRVSKCFTCMGAGEIIVQSQKELEGYLAT